MTRVTPMVIVCMFLVAGWSGNDPAREGPSECRVASVAGGDGITVQAGGWELAIPWKLRVSAFFSRIEDATGQRDDELRLIKYTQSSRPDIVVMRSLETYSINPIFVWTLLRREDPATTAERCRYGGGIMTSMLPGGPESPGFAIYEDDELQILVHGRSAHDHLIAILGASKEMQ